MRTIDEADKLDHTSLDVEASLEGQGANSMDELSQAWLDDLCEQALRDDKLASALLVIAELNAALTEGRLVKPNYQAILAQMLTAQGVVKVQEIGWQAACTPGSAQKKRAT